MLKIEEIEIREFRGIRELTLKPQRKSFGICGPNGTGKSGIVDAIEFALTGGITRLSGEGTGEVSVKAHGPHVDKAAAPQTAVVKLKLYAPSLNKSFTVERSIKAPNAPKVEPQSPDIVAIMTEAARHPEFALSRREIAKYVVTPANQRAKDVQNLLRLDDLEKVRAALTRVSNDKTKDATSANREREKARRELQEALGIEKLDAPAILAAINRRRKMLGLSGLVDLSSEPVIEELASAEQADKPKISKGPTVAAIQGVLAEIAKSSEDGEQKGGREALVNDLETLIEDTKVFTRLRQIKLVEAGLDLVDSSACPLCDKE